MKAALTLIGWTLSICGWSILCHYGWMVAIGAFLAIAGSNFFVLAKDTK